MLEIDFNQNYKISVKEPQVLRVIEPDGTLREEAELGYKPSEGELVKLYRYMVTARVLDRHALLLHRMGKVKSTYGPHEGHEAADAGTVHVLKPEDWIAPYYRMLTALLIRGVPLQTIWAKFFAKQGDPDKGRNLTVEWGGFAKWRILSVGAPIGHQYIYAAGFAYALRYMKRDEIVAAYIGDGGTSTNGFHTGLNFAGIFKLPVVFYVYNNQYAISVPVRSQTAVTRLAIKAAAYGIEGIATDGMDLLAVLKAAHYAVSKARRGEPVLVELITYRFGPHTTADDPATRYRDPAEAEEWRRYDPIARLGAYFKKYGILTEREIKLTWEEAEAEVKVAAKEAESYPEIPKEWIVEDVYSFIPPHLREELEEL